MTRTEARAAMAGNDRPIVRTTRMDKPNVVGFVTEEAEGSAASHFLVEGRSAERPFVFRRLWVNPIDITEHEITPPVDLARLRRATRTVTARNQRAGRVEG